MPAFSVIEKLYVAVQIRLYISIVAYYLRNVNSFLSVAKKLSSPEFVKSIGQKMTLDFVFAIQTITFCLSVRLPFQKQKNGLINS